MTLVIVPLTIFMVSQRQTTTQNAAVSVNCDINLDHSVTQTDYTILLTCIQKGAACTNLNRLASDLNNDQHVDEKDLNFYLTHCKAVEK